MLQDTTNFKKDTLLWNFMQVFLRGSQNRSILQKFDLYPKLLTVGDTTWSLFSLKYRSNLKIDDFVIMKKEIDFFSE